MNLIFLGDVVGKGGRAAVVKLLPELKREFNAQFAIVNGENSAAGAGLSASCVRETDIYTLNTFNIKNR